MSLRANFEDEAPSSDEELNCKTILEESTRSIELNKVHNYTYLYNYLIVYLNIENNVHFLV